MTKYEGMLDGYSQEELDRLSKTTGAEAIPESERRPPLIKWNLDTRDENGTRITPDKLYNCQSGDMSDYMLLAILMIKKGREKSEFVDGKKSLYCRSNDSQVGVDPETGTLKDCDTCMDRHAKRGERKPCTPTIRIIAYDLERNQAVVFDIMRSSYVPFTSYLEKTFFGQIQVGKSRRDIPLYMLSTRVTLHEEEGQGKIYYVPTFTADGPIANKETVMGLNLMAEHLRGMKKEIVADDGRGTKTSNHPNNPNSGGEEPPPIDDQDVPF